MPGLRNSFAETLVTVVMHPKVFLPYAVYSVVAALAAYSYVGAVMENYLQFPDGTPAYLVAWQIGYYAFFFVATPFFEGWTYYMLSIFFAEGRMSLHDGMLNAIRKYPGFLGLEAIYYAASLLLSLPLAAGMAVLFAGLIITRHPEPRWILATMGAVILVSVAISILVQAFFLFMKPVYAHTGHFFASVQEGLRASRMYFSRAAGIGLIVTGWGMLLSIPSILFLVDLFESIASFQVSPFSLHFPLWFFAHMACVGLMKRIPFACASTHYYLTVRGWMS